MELDVAGNVFFSIARDHIGRPRGQTDADAVLACAAKAGLDGPVHAQGDVAEDGQEADARPHPSLRLKFNVACDQRLEA